MTSFVKFQAVCSLSLISGSKAYSEGFDLVHRREAARSNAIWQADHAQLGILLVREDGQTVETLADHRHRRLQSCYRRATTLASIHLHR